MGKERIYELAKELKVESKDVLDVAKKKGMSVKNHMSSVDEQQAKELRSALGSKKAQTTSTTNNHSNNTHSQHPVRSHEPAKSSTTSSQTNGHSNQTRPHSNNGQQRPQNRSNGNNNNHRSDGQQRRNSQSGNGQVNNNHRRDNSTSTKPSTTNNNNHRFSNNGSQRANDQRTNNNDRRGQNNNSRNNAGSNNAGHQHNNSNGGRFGGSLKNNNNSKYNRNNNRFNKKNKKKNKNQRIRETNNKPVAVRKDRPLPETLIYSVGMNAQDLGKILHREPAEIVKKLFMLGVMVNQNQSLDKDTIEILAADYGIEAQEKVEVDVADIDKFFDEEEKNTDHLVSRPPVVTVMGHVDHGKTTLLDKLRHTHVTEGEAGGITQAIGAYQVKYNDKEITFLDTPGHAAFTEMRARGANITDITVLVVAADDGVMPQTVEAINHAKAAGTPIIVAVNKIDKPGANPSHVTEQLTEYGLIPEDWGGDTIFVEISAKFGKNLDELLDMILLQAEVMELKANPDQHAAGSVVEARLDKGKGSVATLLVQHGTLHVGDPIVVGNTYGRVRTMTNERGRRIKEATPSTPIEITGLSDVPEAGDRFIVFEDEKTARAAGEERAKRALVAERANTNHVTLDNLFDSLKEGEMKSVPVIIKADVQGSVEALAQSLKKIKVDGVKVDIIHTAVGAINESDVTLAEASNAIIIGFNVRPTPQAKSQADSGSVDIRLHRVIYNAIDEVESAMKGMLEPVYEEQVTGEVEVRELYKASKVGTIVGGMVTSGAITRDASIRLIRDGVVVYEGKLGSLKRFKDDVKEVKQGYELGLTIENFNDVKVNDVIESYIMKEVPVK
ncbi:translation initiation factor IF-2 [Paucilactobacillus vaccinostercus DSM 20634]|uniref:Translation initiation factor IF-2 n=1 Tax=Paucilactobacillus vaccinostercus DSM 20634 TaxID=1423813 RepID=A0A0R2A4T0_9LACO|nr:translation initiation factor IF-2 [Paucilactobacillus vaccinostercus]KRM62462.1 translation initiation factor IF-2 [Paucilactobacillus vaccinostercus DSM 20634]